MSHTAGARSAQQTPGGTSNPTGALTPLTAWGTCREFFLCLENRVRSAEGETGNERAENVEFIEFLDGDFPSAPKP